jgi:hypothetical protein
MTILAVYREPFGFEPRVAHLPEGLSLAELAGRMPDLPDDFDQRGTICINGKPIRRDAWGMVKPKPKANGVPVEVTFHATPMGGGDDGGKQVFALVASLALVALTGGIAAGGIKALGIKGGTFLSRFVAAGVGIVGSLALSALSSPPVARQNNRDAGQITNEGAASAAGNVLEPNGAIPRVIGERKVFPPLAAEPLTYFDGRDEVVEAVFALAGPHRIRDIKVGAAPIESVGVEFETREGWPGDRRLTLVSRQSRTEAMQQELTAHSVSDTDGRTIESTTGSITDALPAPYVAVTRDAPDEQWLHITFPQGLHSNGSSTEQIRVPIRLRIRLAGTTTWRNLPELHFQAANLRQLRATIKLEWSNDPAVSPGAAPGEGFVEARRFSPAQTLAPINTAWTADAWFGASGDAWMDAGNLGTTGVLFTEMSRYTARFVLGTSSFPRGRYEVEIMRGSAFNAATYAPATYQQSGVVWDLFGIQGSPGQIVRTRNGLVDTLFLLRSVSIWNEAPVQTDELALIAVRARNRALESVSCMAGGYVPDWDGTAWRNWTVTDNPAPHLRDVMAGALNSNPVPGVLLDDASFLTWRSAGWKCNALIEDQSVADVANVIAGCGYARPYMSEVYGVVRDYDRSAEAPVQLFTPRNSRGFSPSKAFAKVPDALRVSFRDASRDYEPRQIIVPRPGFIGTPRLMEQVTYEGPVTEAEVRARALYDQKVAVERSTFYSLEAPAEAIVARRGDLVAVQHDLISALSGSGRVVGWTANNAGLVDAVQLDSAVEVINEPAVLAVTDVLAVPDVLKLGLSSGVVIRGASGPATARALSNATGTTDVLQFATPIAATEVFEGALVAVGPRGSETLRLIVFAIEPQEDFTASLTLVDEAPQIWT